MAPHHRQSDQIGPRARRARDTARVRVRRTTALIGVAATTAAVGLGVLAASDTTAHSADATTGRATSTSASAPSTTPTTAVKGAATTATTADPGTATTATHGHHGHHGDDRGPDDLVGRSGDHDVGPVMTPALTGTGTDLDHDTPIALRSMRAIGTTAAVAVTDADCADEALALLAEDLRALDDTCSRFRPDSELRWLEGVSEGRPVVVSPLLFDVVEVACVVAVQTAGIVDPTVGSALVELGYDRDFDDVAGHGMATGFTPAPAPGWWQVRLDREDHTLAIPAGVHLDVGRHRQGPGRGPVRRSSCLEPRVRRPGQPGRRCGGGGHHPDRGVGRRDRTAVHHPTRLGRPGGGGPRRRTGHLGDHGAHVGPRRSRRAPHHRPLDR